MDAYDSFTLDDVLDVEDKLRGYLGQLTSFFTVPADSTYAAPDGEPWNIKRTCSDEIRGTFAKAYQSPYYLVGGGSFAPGTGQAAGDTEGNETCILCVEDGGQAGRGKMAILRLRLDSAGGAADDHDLNTLLAPVCNPLNGGVLEGEVRLGSEWRDYQELMESRPEAFADTGSIHIITDPAEVKRFQEQNKDRKIGVVYNSPYHLMVVDLVHGQEGKPYAYERVLPKIPKGAVVIVPRYQGGFLLLKQYRHFKFKRRNCFFFTVCTVNV